MMFGVRKRSVLALLALAATVAGCSGAPSLAVTTPVPQLPATVPAAPTTAGLSGDTSPVQVLGNKDSGATVSLKVGQVFSLQLTGNRRWSPPAVDTSILQVQVLNVAVPEGMSRWDYKAVASGTSTLETEGACESNTNGPNCLSIVVYKLTVQVTP